MRSSDFSSPYLFVCITDIFEVFTDGREGKVEVEPSTEFHLKLVEVGRAISSKEGLNKLEARD